MLFGPALFFLRKNISDLALHFEGLVLRLGNELVNRLAARLNNVAHGLEGQEALLLLFLFENDLSKRYGGEVLLALVVDNFYVVTIANHHRDLIESYVATVLRIVEFTIRVTLDDTHVRHWRMITPEVVLIQLGDCLCTWHDNRVATVDSRSGQDLLQGLIHGVKSIRDLRMRRAVIAEKLAQGPAESTIAALQALVSRGGRGNLDVSAALAALVATLEPPSPVSYETRATLYAAANELAANEIAYILLEIETVPEEEVEDSPRPVVPNGPVMTLGARKSAARTKDRRVITHLIHDPSLQVVSVLLDNPNLVETDVLVMASRRPAQESALRLIANHPRWSLPRRIRLAIALNPSSPLPLACRICLDLRDSDLREITRNAGSVPLLRGHADRLLQKRALWSQSPED